MAVTTPRNAMNTVVATRGARFNSVEAYGFQAA
jgi:hypothetical protein